MIGKLAFNSVLTRCPPPYTRRVGCGQLPGGGGVWWAYTNTYRAYRHKRLMQMAQRTQPCRCSLNIAFEFLGSAGMNLARNISLFILPYFLSKTARHGQHHHILNLNPIQVEPVPASPTDMAPMINAAPPLASVPNRPHLASRYKEERESGSTPDTPSFSPSDLLLCLLFRPPDGTFRGRWVRG